MQAARNALRAEDSILQLKKDWMSLDLHTVFAHTLYAVQPLGVSQQYIEMVPECACVCAVYIHLDYGVLGSKWLHMFTVAVLEVASSITMKRLHCHL